MARQIPNPHFVCPSVGDTHENDDAKISHITNTDVQPMRDISQPHRFKPVAHVKPMMSDTSSRLSTNTAAIVPQLSPNLHHKTTSDHVKTPTLSPRAILTATKAKKCRFFRNGDRFFKGVCIAISSERYRTLDSVAEELTRALLGTGCISLPSGVRVLYGLSDGHKVCSKFI